MLKIPTDCSKAPTKQKMQNLDFIVNTLVGSPKHKIMMAFCTKFSWYTLTDKCIDKSMFSSLFFDGFHQISREPLGIQKQMISHLKALIFGYLEPVKEKGVVVLQNGHPQFD